MRDCPNRDGKKVIPNVLKDDVETTSHFYALRTRRENSDESDHDVGMSFYLVVL